MFDNEERHGRMRLVKPQGQPDAFEEPENRFKLDLNEARRYAQLDRLLYRVLQIQAIYERRVDTETTGEGTPLQQQLDKAQQQLDQIFNEIR